MTSIPTSEYQPGMTDTLEVPETVVRQPERIILTNPQQQALTQMALQQQNLLAAQQINLQIDHFHQTGKTIQTGANQFKIGWICPRSVCGFWPWWKIVGKATIPHFDCLFLPCRTVSERRRVHKRVSCSTGKETDGNLTSSGRASFATLPYCSSYCWEIKARKKERHFLVDDIMVCYFVYLDYFSAGAVFIFTSDMRSILRYDTGTMVVQKNIAKIWRFL